MACLRFLGYGKGRSLLLPPGEGNAANVQLVAHFRLKGGADPRFGVVAHPEKAAAAAGAELHRARFAMVYDAGGATARARVVDVSFGRSVAGASCVFHSLLLLIRRLPALPPFPTARGLGSSRRP